MALQNAGATYACVFLAKALAAGGGIGGGGCVAARLARTPLRRRVFSSSSAHASPPALRLLVPVFILVAGVPPSDAVPLSICAIAGGAVANFIAYSQRRRGDGAPLIDYGCVALFSCADWPD